MRLGLAVAVAISVLLVGSGATSAANRSAASQTAGSPAAKLLVASRLAGSTGGWKTPYRDVVLRKSSLGALRFLNLVPPPGFWGGTYTASNGDAVNVAVSAYCFQDPASPPSVAEFFATGLIHGPELAQLAAVVVEPLSLLQTECGGSTNVLACYDPNRELMFVPGDDPQAGIPVESIIAHEYGHHIAFNRLNTPWSAVDWGTKRWASYENICTRTQQGTAVPGDEGEHYMQNPGEAFAETYRVLNELRWGATTTSWGVVDDSFFPDARAIQAVNQDVTIPWTANTALRRRGVFFQKGARVRAYSLTTPLDGILAIRLRSASSRYTASLIDKATGRLVKTGRALGFTLCGARGSTVVVNRRSGRPGSFSVNVSRP